MTKFLFSFFIFISLFSSAQAQHGEGKVYISIASCDSVIDGINVTLDFFQELDFDAGGVATGNGYYLQTIGSDKPMKALGKLKITEKEKVNVMEMFAILSPETKFSEFEVPKSLKNTKVEIFATSFGKTWGVFSCNN